MWVIRLSIVNWVCVKTQILLETLKTQNQLQEGILCVFGSRTICSLKLNVQEAIVCVSHFHSIGSYFFGYWFANGWNSCSWSMGCDDRSITFSNDTHRYSLTSSSGRLLSAGADRHTSHKTLFEHEQFISIVCSRAHSLTTRTRVAQGRTAQDCALVC